MLRLLAAEGKLFAVTLDGRIMAFGCTPGSPKVLRNGIQAWFLRPSTWRRRKPSSSAKAAGKATPCVSASRTGG